LCEEEALQVCSAIGFGDKESISKDGYLVQQRSDFDQNEGGAEGKNNLLLLLLKITVD
jgi:hypothetical protein